MGAVASLGFCIRNFKKCKDEGETTRGVVGATQMVGALDCATNILKKTDGAVDFVFGKIGMEGVPDKFLNSTGAASKLGAMAQSAVNPLLCVAAGARVLKDDDQYSALIEETSAMAAMFGAEALMKYGRASVTRAKQSTGWFSGKIANMLNNSEKIKGLGEKAGNWFKNLGATSHGNAKQMAVRACIDALFIAGSIMAYNIGHKAGEALSNREKA